MEKLSAAELEELRAFDTPTVYNAIKALKIRSGMEGFGLPGLTQYSGSDVPMVGYAVTCRVDSRTPMTEDQKGLRFEYYRRVLDMGPPSVAVVEDLDPEHRATFWGEVQSTTHLAMGAVGTICEGTVRDIPAVREAGFYFFAKAPGVASGDSHVVASGCPVRIRGITVNTGDLIHADRHGFVIIPPEAAHGLAAVCRKIADAELPVLAYCRRMVREGRQLDLDDLKKVRDEMTRLRREAAE